MSTKYEILKLFIESTEVYREAQRKFLESLPIEAASAIEATSYMKVEKQQLNAQLQVLGGSEVAELMDLYFSPNRNQIQYVRNGKALDLSDREAVFEHLRALLA